MKLRLPPCCLLVLTLRAFAAPEDDVRATDARRIAALLHADRPALEAVLADDLSYGHADGRRQNKTELLVALTTGLVAYESYEGPAPSVRVEGNAAWLAGTAELKASAKGERVQLRLRYLAVYRKNGDAWQLAAYQSTPLLK